MGLEVHGLTRVNLPTERPTFYCNWALGDYRAGCYPNKLFLLAAVWLLWTTRQLFFRDHSSITRPYGNCRLAPCIDMNGNEKLSDKLISPAIAEKIIADFCHHGKSKKSHHMDKSEMSRRKKAQRRKDTLNERRKAPAKSLIPRDTRRWWTEDQVFSGGVHYIGTRAQLLMT